MYMGIIYSLLSIFFMGISPVLNKFALISIDHYTLGLWGSLVCLIILAPFVIKKKIVLSKKDYKYLLISGLSNSVALYFFFLGLYNSSPVLMSLLNRTYIIFSIFLGIFLLREKVTKNDIIMIPVTITGLFLFLYKDHLFNFQMGALCGVLSGLFFSISNFTIKKKLTHIDSTLTLFFINFSTSIFFLLLYLEKYNKLPILPTKIGLIAYIISGALFGSILGLFFFYQSIKVIPFYKANIIRSISPIFSFFTGYFFFPIHLTSINIAGLFIILITFFTYAAINAMNMNQKNIIIKKK